VNRDISQLPLRISTPVKFTYIALATGFSLYLAFGVAGRALPHTPAPLVLASHGLAIVCLLSCALSLNHSKAAFIVLAPGITLYTVLAFHDLAVSHGVKNNLLRFTLKLSCTVCGCLAAATREEKEEEERNRDMSDSIERDLTYPATRPPGA